MASKHPNVVIGTAAWPPHHWPAELVAFANGPGRGKLLLGTSFPVVGHRHALSRLGDVALDTEARNELLAGAARRIFQRLAR